ncbi:sensor histidine kinase [Hufsiella ginkgonis]|uniref:histidine kinase n=1 Tax=Hufsiella ginkgonis TaxID=2695274 RepID=A0A7K1XVQ5_9SPHI|nr:HAMP domain-containing sensor histidine kinase [Hufsiella ginkgonis]MXV15060.1 sensor histidine kinase [Hufsiella ginkgonis]
MIEVVAISLENEMDLVLAHKRSMRVAEKLGLTTATQTTFATAVSEIARTVIEHTDNGNLVVGLEQHKLRYSLKAFISFGSSVRFTKADEGYYYAQKLVPEFSMTENAGTTFIEMKIGLPRSLRLDPSKINALKEYFVSEPPLNAYEEIKQRNLSLNKLAEEREEEIRRSKIVDEQKTEFISIASHEIKTPITIIKAYTQMVKKASADQCSDNVKSILEKVDQQSTKLLLLVQQLLDVSKMENGNLLYDMEETALNPFITDMVSVMKNILPGYTVITNLGENVQVNIDKIRMEQVFSNLLGNGAKYSAPNSTITISSVLTDGYVEICIADQGIGMSPTSIASIFKKFYRDKDVVKTHAGLGMGLYIASKIVTDHGGSIWAESEESVGSKFFFTIPLAKQAVVRSE